MEIGRMIKPTVTGFINQLLGEDTKEIGRKICVTAMVNKHGLIIRSLRGNMNLINNPVMVNFIIQTEIVI
jgi:hypothetical protein